MGVSEILSQLDREIAQLKQARSLLNAAAGGSLKAARKGKGTRKKRNLTPEGRKRIAEAVKRRWARQKAAASK